MATAPEQFDTTREAMRRAAVMEPDVMAKCFNEWMRRYVEEPERFEAEFQTVQRFCAEMSGGKEPSYGDECAEYMRRIRTDLKL
jgi:hypothetical protein